MHVFMHVQVVPGTPAGATVNEAWAGGDAVALGQHLARRGGCAGGVARWRPRPQAFLFQYHAAHVCDMCVCVCVYMHAYIQHT